MPHPKVFIIILNWNGLKDTLECLESVFKLDYPNFEVIVVDNGSTDNSVEVIRKAYPQVILIENKKNLGYAEGNNVGIRYALKHGADYVWLLNNDTVVDADALKNLVKVAEKNENVGILGSKIYYYDKPNIICFAGATIDWEKGTSPHIGDGEIDKGQYDAIKEVDRVTGCSMLVKKEVCETIGLLDENFFLYVEEVDWCVRAKKAGFKCMIVPDSKVYHKISISVKKISNFYKTYYMNRNFLYLIKKNHSFPIREKLILKFIFSKIKYQKRSIAKLILSKFFSNLKLDPHDLSILFAIKDFLMNKKGKVNHQTF